MNKWMQTGLEAGAAVSVPLLVKPADRPKMYAQGAIAGLAMSLFGSGDVKRYGRALGFGCLGAHVATTAGTTGDFQADGKTAWAAFKRNSGIERTA